MRVVLLLVAAVACCAMGAPTVDVAVPTAAPDPFIAFIKDMEAQPFFKAMTNSYRLLTFEMLTAAETGNLAPLLDRLGYVQLLKYLDLLPADFSHNFISYVVQHLEMEGITGINSFFKP